MIYKVSSFGDRIFNNKKIWGVDVRWKEKCLSHMDVVCNETVWWFKKKYMKLIVFVI